MWKKNTGNWIVKAKKVLVESFLGEVDDARTIKDLKTKIFCACAKLGLFYNDNTNREVKERFLNLVSGDQNFFDFKNALLEELTNFLSNAIK